MTERLYMFQLVTGYTGGTKGGHPALANCECVRHIHVADCPVADCPVADCPVADCPVADCPVADCPVADCHVADYTID